MTTPLPQTEGNKYYNIPTKIATWARKLNGTKEVVVKQERRSKIKDKGSGQWHKQ